MQNTNNISQWSLPKGAKARLGKGGIGRIRFSPDGAQFATLAPIGIWIYDANTYQEITFLSSKHSNGSTQLPPSWSGTTLITIYDDDSISLWGTDSDVRRIITSRHSEDVYDFAVSPDNATLVTVGWDKRICYFERHTGRFLFSVIHTDRINTVAFSPDGQVVATGGDDKTIHLWDAKNGIHLRTLGEDDTSIEGLAYSPNGVLIASRNSDEAVSLWDVQTGEKRVTLGTELGNINEMFLDFSPDGTLIACGSGDNTVRIWNAITGHPLTVLRDHDTIVETVIFSPDNTTLVSGSSDKTIKFWDIETYQVFSTIKVPCHVYVLSISPDGRMLASSGEDGPISLWDIHTKSEIAILTGHIFDVDALEFSVDGRTLASGGTDGTVILWDIDAVVNSQH